MIGISHKEIISPLLLGSILIIFMLVFITVKYYNFQVVPHHCVQHIQNIENFSAQTQQCTLIYLSPWNLERHNNLLFQSYVADGTGWIT